MSVNSYGNNSPQATEDRSILTSMKRGTLSRCPNCGNGKIFEKGLRVVDQCGSCGQALHHQRADDLPAYLNIFIVGHVVVALVLIVMDMKILGMWELIAAASAVALVLSLLLMRPLKGMIVGVQWALRMHGFDGHDD